MAGKIYKLTLSQGHKHQVKYEYTRPEFELGPFLSFPNKIIILPSCLTSISNEITNIDKSL